MMKEDALKQLLEMIASGQMTPKQGVDKLKRLPFENLAYARVDHHRSLRKGFPEVVFGEGKTTEHIVGIARAISAADETVMVTRLSPEKAQAIQEVFPDAVYHRQARILVHGAKQRAPATEGLIMVIAAGTSDIPVAEEAVVTVKTMGHPVEVLYDAGVAGIHRLLDQGEAWAAATVFIVVAGMEGALPSVVGGLVDKPVIAVPTSVGYGASFGGITPLFAMLNSCASNVTVVNIDNGFGAGYVAVLINTLAHSKKA